jgi:DNA-directed RNA polymerase specialized sigma24 family protein
MLPSLPSAHEDIAQQAMVQACKPAAEVIYDRRQWLRGVVRHEVYRWLRTEVYPLGREAPEDPDTLEAALLDPEEACRELDRRELVQACLAELPAAQREALVWCDGEDQPMPDLTVRIGIPVNTGYSRLRAGRSRLEEAVTRELARRKQSKDDYAVPLLLPFRRGAGDAVPEGDTGAPASLPVPSPRTGARSEAPASGFAAARPRLRGARLWLSGAVAGGALAIAAWLSLGLPRSSCGAVAEAPAALEATLQSRTVAASEATPALPAAPPAASAGSVQPAGRGAASAKSPGATNEVAWAQRIATSRRKAGSLAVAPDHTAFHKTYPRTALQP